MSEEWEIELRKELEGLPLKNDWEDQLKKDLPPEKILNKKNTRINITLIMLVLVIILGITTLFVFNHKTKYIEKVLNKKVEIIEPATSQEIIEINKKIDSLIESQKELQDKTIENSNKIKKNSAQTALLGILLNENFLIMRNNYDKKDIILLDRDWKIKELPKYLTLEDDDKMFLNKYKK